MPTVYQKSGENSYRGLYSFTDQPPREPHLPSSPSIVRDWLPDLLVSRTLDACSLYRWIDYTGEVKYSQ